jgi:hypothetical protein
MTSDTKLNIIQNGLKDTYFLTLSIRLNFLQLYLVKHFY